MPNSPTRSTRIGETCALDRGILRATLLAVASLVETRDPDGGDHLLRIRAYCRHLMDRLDPRCPAVAALPSGFAGLVAEASTLHDIGKAAVPETILLKPGGLTAAERKRMQSHAVAGYRTMSRLIHRLGPHPFLTTARDIAYAHHERWDGTGYPRGLRGEQIPLAARVVAVADVFDALVSRRCYKQAMPPNQAREIIMQGQGTHFDPMIVRAFAQAAAPIERVARGAVA